MIESGEGRGERGEGRRERGERRKSGGVGAGYGAGGAPAHSAREGEAFFDRDDDIVFAAVGAEPGDGGDGGGVAGRIAREQVGVAAGDVRDA